MNHIFVVKSGNGHTSIFDSVNLARNFAVEIEKEHKDVLVYHFQKNVETKHFDVIYVERRQGEFFRFDREAMLVYRIHV